MIEIGRVSEITRYPVKSMAGFAVESATVGWHGLAGDRRLAFRRIGDQSDFPWLSASRLAELILYHPWGADETTGEPQPTHVVTPTGSRLELGSAELDTHVSNRLGSPVELMKLKHGVFDEAAMSVISLATVGGVGRELGLSLDRRRFRANIVVETERNEPFLEDDWVGGALVFGNDDAPVVVSVTQRDPRCAMINLDPETAERDPRIMKMVARLNENHAGVYATVVRTGLIRAGDRVRLARDDQSAHR
jgi:MOSC domain-containing protein